MEQQLEQIREQQKETWGQFRSRAEFILSDANDPPPARAKAKQSKDVEATRYTRSGKTFC